MYMPYASLHDDKGYVSMDFALWRGDGDGDGDGKGDKRRSFFDRLDELHTLILSKAPELCQGDPISPLRAADGFYPRRLKVRGVVWKELCTFDAMCQEVDRDAIRIEEPLRCLLQLRYVWMNGGMHGIKYQIVQVQTRAPSWKTCLMPPVLAEPPDDAGFAAYDKMKKAGVQVEAIRHKMVMDGLSEDAIKRWASRLPGPSPPPPPPPPPPPSHLVHQHHRPLAAPIDLSALLSGKKLLKSVSDSASASALAPAPKKRQSGGYEAPSLNDLLKARGMLRRVIR
jgi:hypothetical protein